MRVIMYMAQTPNGYIARENDDSDFISGSEWKAYLHMVKRSGNIIMGRRTYEVVLRDQEGFPFPNALNVVMTHRMMKNRWPGRVIFTGKTPKQVISLLKERGFKDAFLAGGAKLNASFMKQKLVNEVYLDIVPHMLGMGIKLFDALPFESKLKLVGTRRFTGGFIQLHYKVL